MFRTQSKEVWESGGYQTNGVEMVVTGERVVLLDTQPVLSESLLEQLTDNESMVPPGLTPDAYLEVLVSVWLSGCGMSENTPSNTYNIRLHLAVATHTHTHTHAVSPDGYVPLLGVSCGAGCHRLHGNIRCYISIPWNS